jgi:hypothetical protein
MAVLDDLDDAELAALGLSWERLTRYMPHLPEEDLWVLAWCNGRYVVSGVALSKVEYAIEKGIPRDRIVAFLQREAAEMDGGP